MNIVHHGNAVSMTSLELVDFINEHRKRQAEAAGVDFPSREFAKLRHDQFMAKVPKVLGETSPKFLGDLPDSYGRLQPGYRFPKRESCLMAMSYSYELQAAVFDHMTALESKLNQQAAVALPADYITALEHLLESKRAEQAAIAERDHAIATKAQIGNKREATAMATAAAERKKSIRLEQELGRGALHATIIAVEKATGKSFGGQGFRPLKKWCKSLGVTPPKVPCPRYGKATSWPAGAWLDAYGIELTELFEPEWSA